MRRRLGLVALAITALVVVAFVVPLGLLVRNQARDRALARAQRDTQAVASGLSVAVSLTPDNAATTALAELVLLASGAPDVISIILPDDQVVGLQTPISSAVERARAGAAFTVITDNGAEVVIPVTGPGGTVVVRTFVPTGDLRSGVFAAWAILAALGLLLIAVALLVADRLGRSVVRSVGGLATAAHELGTGDLDARVEPEGPPEIVEVGESFNYLAERLEDLIAEERESVADLSHRLRTPLAALRLQAETLDDKDSSRAMVADIDRLERAIDQLIEDARSNIRSSRPRSADLGAVAAHRAAFWAVLAEDQDRRFEVAVDDGEILVGIDSEDLGAVVDVLLENVFSHTEPGTPLQLQARHSPAGGTLIVADGGPGLPDDAVLIRGASGTGSTGLGLDITRRAAERTGGGVILRRSSLGGAAIEVTFGKVRPGTPSAAATDA